LKPVVYRKQEREPGILKDNEGSLLSKNVSHKGTKETHEGTKKSGGA
jgi:hypothetical protein